MRSVLMLSYLLLAIAATPLIQSQSSPAQNPSDAKIMPSRRVCKGRCAEFRDVGLINSSHRLISRVGRPASYIPARGQGGSDRRLAREWRT